MKKRFPILLMFFSMFSTAFSQTIINRPGIGDCKLVFEDNFDSTALNTKVWDYRTDTRYWSKQIPENVTIVNGYLYLNVRQQKIGGTDYTGAGVITVKGYKYGYYESRFKIPKGKGWHTSFWMMYKTPSSGIPYGVRYQEVDVCENDSKNPEFYETNLHRYYPTHTSFGGKRVTTPNLADTFHVWGCEYTPTVVNYFFEGKLVRTLDNSNQNQGDASIWLTTIAAPIGGTDTVDVASLPSAAVYDYVRFYELLNPVFPDTTDTARIKPNPANVQIIVDNTDAGCTFNGIWTESKGVEGFYGVNYFYFASINAENWAKWTPVIPEEGNYRIYMRWTANPNRPAAVPVEINHINGVSTVKVDQTQAGGRWNYLGSFQLNKGNANYVKVTCGSGPYTIADAVLFEKMPPETALPNSTAADGRLSILTDRTTGVVKASFGLQKSSVVSLKVYNICGELVSVVVSQQQLGIGNHAFNVKRVGMPNGLYVGVLTLDNRVITRKFIYS